MWNCEVLDTFLFPLAKFGFVENQRYLIKYILSFVSFFVRGDVMRVDERTIQNATDSDGGASATELLTLVAPGSKGGFLNNNLRGIAQLAYTAVCSSSEYSI